MQRIFLFNRPNEHPLLIVCRHLERRKKRYSHIMADAFAKPFKGGEGGGCHCEAAELLLGTCLYNAFKGSYIENKGLLSLTLDGTSVQ